MKRLLFDIVAVLFALFSPWWGLTIIFACLGFWFFNKYFEGIILMFIADAVFGSASFIPFPFPFGVGSIIVYFIISSLKNRVRISD